MLLLANIAPPKFAKLPMNLLLPAKVTTVLKAAPIAPPYSPELCLKALVPVKLNDVLLVALIAPPVLLAKLPIK